MTREEILSRQSQKYRDFREKCGVKDPVLLDEVDEAYFLGAMWADEHSIHYDTILKKFEKNRLKHCANLTDEQYDLERNFTTSHIEKHHRSPTFIDAIEYGTEKGKEEMLKKAIEWLKEHSWDYLVGDNFKDEKMVSDFKKAMEE